LFKNEIEAFSSSYSPMDSKWSYIIFLESTLMSTPKIGSNSISIKKCTMFATLFNYTRTPTVITKKIDVKKEENQKT